MNYKRVIFAGFFLKSDVKIKFTDLFKIENKLFLESSQQFCKYDNDSIKFFPMNIFHMRNNRIWNLIFNRVEVDSTFIELYRRDLKIFKNTYMKQSLPQKKTTFVFFVYWALRELFKSSSDAKSFSKTFQTIRNAVKPRKDQVYSGEEDIYYNMSSLKLLAFRLAFLNGYIYIKKLVEKLDVGEDDLIVLWGSHNSGARILKKYMEARGVNCFISEYGELPGTFSLNKDGIFGDSELAKNWDKIISNKQNDSAILNTKSYLEKVEKSQSSSRGSSSDDQLWAFFRKLYQPKTPLKKVIYVSGVELIASGHLFNKEFVKPKMLNANKMLLEHVLSQFNSEDYIIVYKDHPLMQKNYPDLTLVPEEFKGVMFLNSMSVDNLVSLADITISLPSKVIITCLMYRKPVYTYGDFSIPKTVPELGYYTGRDVAEIKSVVDSGINQIDPNLYPSIACEFQNYLIRVDDQIFEAYEKSEETKKIDDIINPNSIRLIKKCI